jgi:hypothetical protein
VAAAHGQSLDLRDLLPKAFDKLHNGHDLLGGSWPRLANKVSPALMALSLPRAPLALHPLFITSQSDSGSSSS